MCTLPLTERNSVVRLFYQWLVSNDDVVLYIYLGPGSLPPTLKPEKMPMVGGKYFLTLLVS